MAGYVHGKPGHDQPRKILARNPEREVGAFPESPPSGSPTISTPSGGR